MPFDQRMRDGLHRNADVLDPDVDRALDASRARGNRLVWTRRAAGGGATAAALIVLAVLLTTLPDQTSDRVADRPDALAGVWQTEVQSRDEIIARVIGQGGDPDCVSDFIGGAERLRFTLAVDGDRWVLYRSKDDGRPRPAENGFWDTPAPGRLRFFVPTVGASYLFDRSAGTSGLDLELRNLALGGDPEACFVRAGVLAEFAAPFARVADPVVEVPTLPDDAFGIGTTPIEGPWRSQLLPESQLRNAIDAAGASGCVDRILGGGDDRRFTLSIQGDRWTIADSSEDAPRTGTGWIQAWPAAQTSNKLLVRLTLLDRPEVIEGWVRPDSPELDVRVTDVSVASADPSCEALADAAVWFGGPFSPAR